MNKRRFVLPYVALDNVSDGGDVIVIGGGTGQGGSDPVAISFAEWKNSKWSEGRDLGEPGLDFQDYIWWWIDSNLSQEAWNAINTETPWGTGDYDWIGD